MGLRAKWTRQNRELINWKMSECEKSILQHGVTKEGPIQKR